MKYVNSDAVQRAKFLARASYLADNGKDAELKELRPSARRRAAQLACWHAWSATIAETVDATQEDVERDIKRRVLGMRKTYDVFTDAPIYEDYRTKDFDEEQLGRFLSKVRQWAIIEHGWTLPSREDIALMQMDQL